MTIRLKAALLLPAKWKRVAVWLLLASVFLRAVIPVGFMPNYAAFADDAPLLMLCPSGFAQDQFEHYHGHDDGKGETDHRAYVCAFAILAALAASTWSGGLLPPSWDAVGHWSLPKEETRTGSQLHSTWSARSPPLML